MGDRAAAEPFHSVWVSQPKRAENRRRDKNTLARWHHCHPVDKYAGAGSEGFNLRKRGANSQRHDRL